MRQLKPLYTEKQFMIRALGTLLRAVAQQSRGAACECPSSAVRPESGKFTEAVFSRLPAMAQLYRGAEIRDKIGEGAVLGQARKLHSRSS